MPAGRHEREISINLNPLFVMNRENFSRVNALLRNIEFYHNIFITLIKTINQCEQLKC